MLNFGKKFLFIIIVMAVIMLSGLQKVFAAQEIKFEDVNETVYTTERVNLRTTYGTTGKIVTTLAKDTELTRTGKSDTKVNGYEWSQVKYKGATYYCIAAALTSQKADSNSNTTNTITTSATTENKTNTVAKNTTTSSTTNETKVQNIVQEGTDNEEQQADLKKQQAIQKGNSMRTLIIVVGVAIAVALIICSIVLIVVNNRESDDGYDFEEDGDDEEIDNGWSTMSEEDFEDDEFEEIPRAVRRNTNKYDEAIPKALQEKQQNDGRNDSFEERLEKIKQRNMDDNSNRKGRHF